MPARVEHPAWDSKEHQKMLNEVCDRFDFSEEGKRPHEEIARRAYKHFRAYIDDTNWQFDTKVYEPKLFADTMTHVSRELQAVFQAPPIFRYLPRGRTKFQSAQQMQSVVQYYLDYMDTQGTLWNRYANAAIQRRLFGTVYAHTFWRQEERSVAGWQRVPLLDPIMGQPLFDPYTGEMLETLKYFDGKRMTYDGPWFRVMHFTEAFPDHQTANLRDEDVENDTFFIYRVMRPSSYIKAKGKLPLEEGGWPKAQVERALRSEPHGTGSTELFETIEWQNEIGLTKPTDIRTVEERKWFEVLECWTAHHVTTVVNRSYVMERRPNPFGHGRIPIIQCRNYHVPGEHYGMSDFELVEKLLTALQDMLNVEATVALQTALPIIKHSADVDTRQLRHGIGAKWRVPSKESMLEFLQMPSQGVQISEAIENTFRSRMDSAMGTSDAFRGSGGSQDQTATALSLAFQSAGLRSQYSIDSIDHMFTRPIADDYQWLIRQLCPHDITTRVVGDPMAPPITIPIEEIRDADFIAIPTASSAQSRLLEEKRVAELYQTLFTMQDPNVDPRQVTQMYLEVVAPRYANRLLKPEATVMAEQQQAQQMQQFQMALEMAKASEGPDLSPEAQGPMGREGVVDSAMAQGRIPVRRGMMPNDANNPFTSELASELGADMR